MLNNNIFKALINICLIFLSLYSITAYSFSTIVHYSHVMSSTNILINIYIEQQYNVSPLKINLSFSNLFIIFYIFNISKMNITYSSYFNFSFNKPIISYNKSINVTIVQVNYIFASNMSIILVTPFQYVKIIGNTSNEIIPISLTSNLTSNPSELHEFNFNYIVFILISAIAIFSFIVLRRYKGY